MKVIPFLCEKNVNEIYMCNFECIRIKSSNKSTDFKERKVMIMKTTTQKKEKMRTRNTESESKCIKCNCTCWNNKLYCWDCYKYQMYESK